MTAELTCAGPARRDCQCPIANHEHGTWDAYTNDKCRGEACRKAWADYTRHRRRADAVMAWNGRSRWVTNIGAARRLQALAAVGWGLPQIAELLGLHSDNVLTQWREGRYQRMRPTTARRIAELYDQIWDQRPAGRYPVKVRNIAAARGWVPPLAWDDDEIDDPAAKPHQPRAGRREPAPCGTPAAYRRHLRRGEKPCRGCTNAEARRVTDQRPRTAA